MRIVNALESPLHKTLVLLVACTGLRASEAVALKWGDIEGNLIYVRRRWSGATLDEPKTKRSEAPVACHPQAKRELANSCPKDLDELMEDIIRSINGVKRSQQKLRACVEGSELPSFLR